MLVRAARISLVKSGVAIITLITKPPIPINVRSRVRPVGGSIRANAAVWLAADNGFRFECHGGDYQDTRSSVHALATRNSLFAERNVSR